MYLKKLHHQSSQRWRWVIGSAFGLLVLFSILSLCIGEQFIWPSFDITPLQRMVLVDLRMPRLITVIAVGAMLAVAGAMLQVILRNPLAEPGVLGVSGGASVAVVLTMLLFATPVHPYLLMAVSIAGALAFTFVLVWLAIWRKLSMGRMLLVGVAMGFLAGAIVTWAFYFSDDMNLRQLLYWMMGSASGKTWPQLSVLLVLVPLLLWSCRQGRPLDIMMLGELTAAQLGLDVRRLRLVYIGAIAVLVGGSVALTGVISFIGLVVPHILRLAFGGENRYLLLASALCGALLLTIADLISRIAITAGELPVGAVTATLGAPIFVWLLLKGERYDSV
uniref:vitamin B12 ABC transporter permease BtuC n=1 Tax=Thaumasiovibrio occultus TaxID=1891184 RepID=UPI000B352996|nr:vitamin B12 ABC transporter permease BtuC [Thaumasiovibrio occultus]